MSDILEKFSVFSEISEQFKKNIKLFHIFNEYNGRNVLFITNDDKVFAFGSNDYGQCGLEHNKRVATPQEIPELNGKKIKQFFIGFDFVLALNENNHVFGWGMNDEAQLGRGYTNGFEEYLKPSLITYLENINEISCGNWHSLALDEQGNVFSWGSNLFGQVGCGKEIGDRITRPVQLKELPKNKSIHCYSDRSFAVTFDGLVYSWGLNNYHCLGHNSRDNIYKPELICGLNNVISVGCSLYNTYFLTNEGNIHFCGESDSREISETDLKFQSIQTTDSKLLALSKETVYFFERNSIEKTKYKTFFDYCLNERQITSETIPNPIVSEYLQLGSGNFGTVYKWIDKSDQKTYALKIIPYQDYERILKYQREVQILSKCDERYMVKYYRSWIKKDQFYIQMELCDNNLKNIIQQKRKCFGRTESEPMTTIDYFISSHLMKEILECVQYLHQLDPPIIHRDLKPQNILVNYQSKNGRFLKICDFGVSAFGSKNTISHTRDIGTTKYMAPEVIGLDFKNELKVKYNTKADIYSLGIILCDLFDIDINSFEMKNKELTQNWKELVKLIENMLAVRYSKRPNCNDILLSHNLWAIEQMTEKDYNSEEYQKSVKQMEKFENKFFINYFREKQKSVELYKIDDKVMIKSPISELPIVGDSQRSSGEIENVDMLSSVHFIDKFEIKKELSSGGFGHVFKVMDKNSQNIFVVKEIKLNENLKTLCQEYEKRLKALPESSADYLVKCFDTWIENSFFYIQMELFDNNLETIIKQKNNCFNRNPEEMTFTEYLLSRQLFQEIVECVQYLHESNPTIVHKSLHPSNIFFNEKSNNGRFLKLSDFGLSTFGINKTLSPSLLKNAKYIAPEVIDGPKGEPKYTKKSDIYSLGRIVCDLFDFDLNSCRESIRNRKEMTHNWELLKQIIQKMMSPIYTDRPDCSELLSFCKNWTIDEITGDIEETEKENINQLKSFKFLSNYFYIKRNKFNDSIEESLETNREGFGIVIKAWDKTDNKLYALKIIGIADGAKSSIYDYQNQMILMSELNEEYFVKYYNCFTIEQRLYIKMELCSDNLKNILEEKKLCFERQSDEGMTETEYFISSHLAKEILECVQYLHELKPPIIHRDLKPANILVNYQPNKGKFIKLCDIGLVATSGVKYISRTEYTGTLNYLAPEIGRNVSTKSDIFSLGKIFAELFDFDINRDLKPNEYKNWYELGKSIEKMLSFIARNRPDCKELLSSYDKWAMTENILILNQIKSKTNSELINRMKIFKNKFYLNYFREKFIL